MVSNSALSEAFVTAMRRRTPGSIQAVREAAREAFGRDGACHGEFSLPNRWRVCYAISPATVVFRVGGVCEWVDTATAIHLTASALIAAALGAGDELPEKSRENQEATCRT